MQKLNFNKIIRKAIVLLLTFIVLSPTSFLSAQEDVINNQYKFGRLLRLVDGYYVDSTDVNELTEKAIVHLLSELDPHSSYISKEEVQKMNEPLKGNFEGIGISFNIFKDTLLVLTTIPGGPSEKVGLRAGDRIVEVDGENIAGTGIENTDVFRLLKGKKGTTVELKVLRKKVDEFLDFTIIRDKIPINSVDASFMLDKETGYIKLNRFAATTTDEFVAAINELKKSNLKNLIFDLRGNGGGYLPKAIEISDQFLGAQNLIVYTDGRNEPKREFKATAQGTFETGNLVILVDESSASASEIVSGAIQDWDRGVIIGRRSFGKGLVQKQMFLTDGSLVRLTTAHYYTPSGRCIQKPYDEGVEDYRKDYFKRLENGEMFSADSISFPDSLKYNTLINGRTVYGGGGIMPDIFLPMDTSHYFRYYNKLRSKNIVFNFVLDFIDGNRAHLEKKYPTYEDFNNNFVVTSEMINEIVEKGVEEAVEKDEESLAFTLETMKREIRAYIARDLFSRNYLYKILFEDDKVIKKALEVIEDKNEYNNHLVSID